MEIHDNRFHHRALSLIEVLVVISIIGIIVGLLLPAIQSVRGTAARMSCANNMKQIALASHSYEAQHGSYPPTVAGFRIPGITHRNISLRWSVLLLPHLDHDAIYSSTVANALVSPMYDNPPNTGLTQIIKAYVCPADTRLYQPLTDEAGYTAAYTGYVGVMGNSVTDDNGTSIFKPGIFEALLKPPPSYNGTRISDITDGLSQTLHYGESPPYGKWFGSTWYLYELPFEILWMTRPDRASNLLYTPERYSNLCKGPFPFGPGRVDNPCDSHHYWSLHGSGANFAFADGSVRFLSYSASSILPALATRAGGEVVELP